MPNAKYQHLFLGKEFRNGMAYTRPPRAVPGRSIPRRDVAAHGSYLRGRLDRVWEETRRDLEQRQAVALPVRSGAYLEFRSDPGDLLVAKRLENLPKGIRLLSLTERQIPGAEEPATFATVFVPSGKQGHFLQKVEQYASETTKNGEPRNRQLVDSISDLRMAVLSSFWLDIAPVPEEGREWCEAWLRVEQGAEPDEEDDFRVLCDRLGIQATPGVLRFPERSVIQILANGDQLMEVIAASDHIAELRLAKETAAFWLELPNEDQAAAVEELLGRLEITNTGISVCILDTGVNNGHQLIEPVLADRDLHSVDPSWGTDDHDGHGTLMAGICAYGDLQDALAAGQRIPVTHVLESSKILPSYGVNPPDLYGYMTAQGIFRAEVEAPNRKRIVCMAVASEDARDHGMPSSWSAKVDALASGADDDTRRLIILAAGNTDAPDEWQAYPDAMLTNEVHDPGQSWNSLTVGAFTQKTLIQDASLSEFDPIAPADSISPYTSTSLMWDPNWPAKPDILLEGGNAAVNSEGYATSLDDLSLVSTYYQPQVRHFSDHSMTSAAAGLAARMAAQLESQYPDAWPETIRGLLVHSAEWTDEMRRAFLADETKTSYGRLLRICGYGVPDFNRACWCAANSLTLVAECNIQPYTKKGSRYATRDMHIHELPWPRDELLELGETELAMRITLSYFVEPGPGQVGWQDRYRYSSHGLRFEVNAPGESRDELLVRMNQAARENGQHPLTVADTGRWTIGPTARDRGSIHSDIWRGSAAAIAGSNLIGVYPVIGWWRERAYLGKWGRETRYTLIVSLYAPELDIDIYTPVATQIGIVAPVEVDVEI